MNKMNNFIVMKIMKIKKMKMIMNKFNRKNLVSWENKINRKMSKKG
jgi:hypothetical protein